MKKIILSIAILFWISGCKQYFEPNPKEVSQPIYVTKTIREPIEYFGRNVATLKDGTVLPMNKKLPKGFIAIDRELSKNGTVLLVNGKKIKFNNLIVTAKKRGNLLAVLFSDNHFELYDLNQNKTIASANFGTFLALRKFIAQPYFYKELLLIPSLDGRLIIFDLTSNKVIRSIVVSQKDYFNNIIYLNVKDDNLIIATRDTLLVVSPNMVFTKKYNIKHILVDNNNIYVFTIEGNIIKLNFVLKEIARKEFRYANIIFPMFYNNKIYFLSRGDKSFLISIDKSLTDFNITPLKEKVEDPDCDNDALFLKTNVFGTNGEYFIGDYYLKLK